MIIQISERNIAKLSASPTYDGNEGGDGKADRCGSNLWTCFPNHPGEEQECGAKIIMIRYIVHMIIIIIKGTT